MKRHLVIHAHFYQPPREDPAFAEVEAEASAAPFHDWNQRIERECYRAVVAARLVGGQGRIAHVLNTLEWISFNVGATLFEWMERAAPSTYAAILQADRASVDRLGHGNAMAQPYHHVILPLASRRDKVSEVRWGIADFRRRYGREPEGMWLPECAVDDETLDVLAQEGIRFTVLAPYQVKAHAPNGHAGRYTTATGRTIALFPYHGDLSHGVAFGGLVRDAGPWLQAIVGVEATRGAPDALPLVVSVATDGETYGHHHKFADMALAHLLVRARQERIVVENYGSLLARHPATHEVTLVAPSAWSCAHGVERWRSDCSCRVDGMANPSQAWRTPLREGLDALADGLHQVFAREGAGLFRDSWAARDAYGAIVGSPDAMARVRFMDAQLGAPAAGATADGGGLPAHARQRAFELLEMARDAMRMFTSCAWFFDDIGGLEVQQVLRYAMRAIDLSGARSTLEPAFRAVLATARSNHPATGTGAEVYDRMRHLASPEARAAAATRALRDLALVVEGHLPAAFDATADGELVHVIVRATGRMRAFRVVLDRRTSSDLAYQVTALDQAGAEPVVVPLAEFPERSRHALRLALRRELLPRCLTLSELEQLASGDATLRGLVAVALTRAIQRLATDRTEPALELVHATLDLFEQLETTIPFDAQTAFWEVRTGLPSAEQAALAPLAGRLGFES